MINSRKLGVKAVITVEIHTEGETSQMAASDLKETGTAGSFSSQTEEMPPEVKMGSISPVILALHRKDTYRIRENTVLTGGKTGYRKSIVEGYFHKQPVCKAVRWPPAPGRTAYIICDL